jgi:hypothetical protein
MKKLSVEMCPNKGFKLTSKKIIKKIDTIKMLELLKLDFNRGIIAGVFEIILKDGYIIEDLQLPKNVKIFYLLKIIGNKYTCFIRIQYQKKQIKKILKDFDLDVIWLTFEIKSNNKIMCSVFGDKKSLTMFLKIIKKYGIVKIISFKKAEFENHYILSSLTNKQRETLLIAKKNGYYDYPRAINGYQLSKIIGISKATTIEHLRKAEKRLISQIFVGF